jgi:hypothetical protein
MGKEGRRGKKRDGPFSSLESQLARLMLCVIRKKPRKPRPMEIYAFVEFCVISKVARPTMPSTKKIL